MDKIDVRKGHDAIPNELTHFLTEQQITVLPDLEAKGVSLFAVRRQLFQEPVVIMKFVDRGTFGVLEKNGTVDYFPEIKMRESPDNVAARMLSVFQR